MPPGREFVQRIYTWEPSQHQSPRPREGHDRKHSRVCTKPSLPSAVFPLESALYLMEHWLKAAVLAMSSPSSHFPPPNVWVRNRADLARFDPLRFQAPSSKKVSGSSKVSQQGDFQGRTLARQPRISLWAHCSKRPQTGWPRQQKLILSQLEVQDQGVSRVGAF